MIYFICPSLPYPTGGVKQIHLIASYLIDSGLSVCILYTGKNRPRIWFPTEVPCYHAPPWLKSYLPLRDQVRKWLSHLVRNDPSIYTSLHLDLLYSPVTSEDLFVIPEIFGSQLAAFPPSVPKIILNQNCFLSFHDQSILPDSIRDSLLQHYINSNVIGQLANSPYGEAYLRWSFPNLPTRTLELAVDTPPTALEIVERDPILVYFPRKSGGVVEQVIGMLRNRGTLEGWKLQPLEGLSASEVQIVFSKAKIYVASSLHEGLGLPPLEAMANGCPVVGFAAWGGDEFLTESVSRVVRTGDVLALAQSVENTIKELREQPSTWQEKVNKARSMVSNLYNHKRAAASCINAFGYFLDNDIAC